MLSVYLGLLGLVAFVGGVAMLGIWVRLRPTKDTAERASRIAHSLFFTCLGVPVLIALFYPGLRNLDPLVSLEPLFALSVRVVLGVVLSVPGVYLMGASNVALRALGSGANAFRLTERVVFGNVFEYTRNPMSLGYYMVSLAIALLSGSTLLTLYVVLGLIPAHLFFLLFFRGSGAGAALRRPVPPLRDRVPFLLPTRFPGSRHTA